MCNDDIKINFKETGCEAVAPIKYAEDSEQCLALQVP
jgi:hypothetical protein